MQRLLSHISQTVSSLRLTQLALFFATMLTATMPLRAQQASTPAEQPGALFHLTNSFLQNAVVMYHRAPGGQLTQVGEFNTGGRGSGGINDPLKAQDSLILSKDHALLFAVNAGSSDISVFRVSESGLRLLSVTPIRGGASPISLAFRDDDLLYVLDYVGNFNLSGYRVSPQTGALTFIPGSIKPLSGVPDTDPADIRFTPDGAKFVVTERFTNLIDVFSVGANGVLNDPVFNKSVGIEPFGFTFTDSGVLLVTETNRGMPNGSFVSSYNVNPNNTLTPISKSVSASGLAACWDRTNDRYVYTSDTLSGNLGILSVSPNGTLAAVGPASALGATANPTDSTFDTGNRHFYAFFSGLGEIVGFNVAEDGSLHAITVVQAGAPATGHVGLVAY